MKITDLEIDGFGVWSGLRIDDLSDRITVFYGPNEAGKTTLMQFVRSVLYGFSAGRRRRYLPPLGGGRSGGSLHVAGADGKFQITRHASDDPTDEGRVTITAADGTIQGDQLLLSALNEVDESIFNNVFAVGLRELQELASLSNTEAAAWLYNLTAGLDRVSIVDVMRELEQSRQAILSADDSPSQVSHMLAERKRLEGEVQELAALGRRWSHLSARQEELQRQTTDLEAESNELKHLVRTIEIAIAVKDKWRQRQTVDEQLQVLGGSPDMAEGAVERLDELNQRIDHHRHLKQQLRDERHQLRDEARDLDINEQLWRQAPRIEALGEQQQWIASLERESQEAEATADRLQTEINTQRRSLGLADEAMLPTAPQISRPALKLLRQPAVAMRSARDECKSAAQEATEARAAAASLASQLSSRLVDVPERDLSAALESAGNRVSLLRRRIALDERLDQLRRHQVELEEQGRDMLQRRMMPAWILAGLGAVFVTGVVLVLSGLFLPTAVVGSLGITLAMLGILGTGAVGLVKFQIERSAANHLTACQRQLDLVERQIGQTKGEREEIDADLPRGGGPLVTRLQTAERELAQLEELLPIDARRQMAEQEIAAATVRGRRAQDEYDAARTAWCEALTTAGLPDHLSPKQVRALTSHHGELAKLMAQLARSRQEAQRRHAEYAALAGRIRQLAVDVGLAAQGQSAVEQLRQLLEQLARQESKSRRLEELHHRARDLKRKEGQVVGRLRKLRRHHRTMLEETGADSEQQFRQRALQAARAKLLRRERETLDREITATLGNHTTHERLASLLTDGEVDRLEAHQTEASALLEANQKKLHNAIQERGAVGQEQQQLAEDRRLAEKQLELSVVDQRLADAFEAWQVRTITWMLLESIRKEYEQHRQPETLIEASGYLRRLTDERYVRVWTPLGEDVLYVEDDQGESLSVDVLSRGTREQLFLSLRLALVARLARHGTQLPLVLDDVLVNFDAGRAKAAARVLRDFAKAGHQLLVFTCHEHIWRMFKTMKVDVRRLPDRTEVLAAGDQEEAADEPSREEIVIAAKAGEEPEESDVSEDESYEEDEGDFEEDEFEEEEGEDEEDEYEEDEYEDEEEGEYEDEEEAEAECADTEDTEDEYEEDEYEEDEEDEPLEGEAEAA